MRYYEILAVAHPNLEQEGLTKLIDEIKGLITKWGGEMLYEEIMGKKRLAYTIQKQRYGTYVLLQFKGDGSSNVQLTHDFELHENVLAHMIVKIEEEEVREQVEEAPSGDVEEEMDATSDKESELATEDDQTEMKVESDYESEEEMEEKHIENEYPEEETTTESSKEEALESEAEE